MQYLQMQDEIEIPVNYKNQELLLKAHIKQSGYVNHLIMEFNGAFITIERDEEGQYRVLGDAESLETKKVDLELVKAVIEVLESL